MRRRLLDLLKEREKRGANLFWHLSMGIVACSFYHMYLAMQRGGYPLCLLSRLFEIRVACTHNDQCRCMYLIQPISRCPLRGHDHMPQCRHSSRLLQVTLQMLCILLPIGRSVCGIEGGEVPAPDCTAPWTGKQYREE